MIIKDFDKLTDKEKQAMQDTALLDLFNQLGPNDIFKQIVLEEVFKFMMGEEEEEQPSA